MNIELVIFDMAGTTVRDDDAVSICLRQALDAKTSVTRDEVIVVMELPKPIAIRLLLEQKLSGTAAVTNTMVESVYQDFLGRMLQHYRTARGIGPMPHTLETFHQLKHAGVRLALDTGFSRPIVDAILERLNWKKGGLLDATVASDEVKNGRPHA